jgi:hydrogenase maturation factor
MKKIKLTKKQIIDNFPTVIKASYCSMQNLLHLKNASFYTGSKTYSWTSDIYVINDNVAISTGYQPIGNVKTNCELLKQYDDQAAKIIALYPATINYSTLEIKLNILLNDFILKTIGR